MKIFTVLLLIFSFSLSAHAQNQAEYTIAAVKGEYLIIGQKPYKKLGTCEDFKVADKVAFSEDPITCEKVTAINLLSLSKCELECLENLEPPPYPDE